ncbi:hypothetical protein OE88DRAFT_1660513 [Heliocybe sulcata]|uniref:Uncharacterized protein n=1 Tax=Heliocybe sulcata TaxID=5364 RepID=A0A5C3MZS5_9AGAM|nr:hypothetical protein OE88DRAFT_1660513 [Heliocybe sulcata]
MSTITEQQQQPFAASLPSSTSKQNSPPTELRRVTSSGQIATPRDTNREHRLSARQSQLLQTAPRLGSRSPNSIPSSPTSAHSSSSAIFERDIEAIVPSQPTHAHGSNPHLIPRSKGTEAIEQSVPSVLDSAAAVLASTSPDEEDFVAVVAPAPDFVHASTSGFTSPIGSSRSRSPSPGPHGNRTSLLLNLPSPPSGTTKLMTGTGIGLATTTNPSSPTTASQADPSSPTRPKILTQPQPPSDASIPLSTPTSAYFSAASISSAGSSPTTTTMEHPPDDQSLHTPTHSSIVAVSPSDTYGAIGSMSASPTTAPLSAGISHPPSPKSNAAKRLSFMSYADLLSSTPASTLPLSSLTTSATAADPPPHIPSVSGIAQASQSHTASAASSIHHGREAADLVKLKEMKEGPLDPILLEDDGGEWEREGLGKGLEERLEALMVGRA